LGIKIKTRLEFPKKLDLMMNLVVKWGLGVERAAMMGWGFCVSEK
jgi:hypothetical protein